MGLGEEYDRRDGIRLGELVALGGVHPPNLIEEAIARADRVNPWINTIVHADVRGCSQARERRARRNHLFRGVSLLLLKDPMGCACGASATARTSPRHSENLNPKVD